MTRSYTSSPTCASMACSGIPLPFTYVLAGIFNEKEGKIFSDSNLGCVI
jgi:hypothetical protein